MEKGRIENVVSCPYWAVEHAQVAAQSVIAAALTLDAHMEKLRKLRDKADQRGQMSAAIRAEKLRGQLKRFYVKQVESGDAATFRG